MSCTTKISDYCFETATTVGAHEDTEESTHEVETKVVTRSGKGVRRK